MTYLTSEANRWFSGTLCCRYVVVRFDRLRVPMLEEGAVVPVHWRWALGCFTGGEFEVLGAWRDDGAGTASRVATDLHDRGLERVGALAADDDLILELAGFRPRVCRNTTAQLIDSGALGSRMRRAVRWTEVAGEHLQTRMSVSARRHGPFVDEPAVAAFMARSFQRAHRDLLADGWDRAHPARFGQAAFAAFKVGAA